MEAVWNAAGVQSERGGLVHNLLAAQARPAPDAVVVFADKRLTHQRLEEHSNHLAHYLCKQGADRQSIVGLCVERSLEMAVCLVGVLKAASAYLLFDWLGEQMRTRPSEYVLPSAVVELDQIPLTANGEADRKRLPVPEVRSAENEYVPPMTAAERSVAPICDQMP